MYPIMLTAVLAVPLARAQQPLAASPALVTRGEELLAAWVEPGGQRLLLSTLEPGGWSEPRTLLHSARLALDPPLLAVRGDSLLLSWTRGERRLVGVLEPALRPLGSVPAGPAALLGERLLWLDDGALRTARLGDTLGTPGTIDPRVCPDIAPAAAMLGSIPVVAWADRDGDDGGVPTLGLGLGDDWEAVPVLRQAEPACDLGGVAVASGSTFGAAVAWWQGGATRELRLAMHGEDGQVGPLVIASGEGEEPRLLALGDGLVVAWAHDSSLVLVRVDAQGRVSPPTRVEGIPPEATLATRGEQLVLAWASADGLQSLSPPSLPAAELPGQRVLPPGPPLPDPYVLPDLAGDPVDVTAMRGRPLLVNLWASWCPPCLVELPQLKALHQQWAPRGLQVLGIAIDDKPDKVQRRIDQHGIPWPVLFDGSSRASHHFRTSELPTTVLFDAAGQRTWAHQGELQADDPELQAALERLLAPARGSAEDTP